MGNRTTVTDPLLRTTTTTYDGVGRLTTVTDPLQRVTTSVYDQGNCAMMGYLGR